jgi:hypothetical protein
VYQITQASVRLRKHLGFPALQALPLARALRLPALCLATRRQPFIPVLHCGFRGTTTHQHGGLAIRGRQQRIDAQVHPDDGLLDLGNVWNLTYQQQCGHTKTHFHEPSRHLSREGNSQAFILAVRQEKMSVSQSGILVGVHDITVSGLFPGIARLVMPVLAELPRTMHCFTEFPNDLLGTLGAQTAIPPFRPLLPALFAGPLQMTTSYAMMTFYQITPQASGFLARGRKCVPLRSSLWQPVYFYRTIAHTLKIALRACRYNSNRAEAREEKP